MCNIDERNDSFFLSTNIRIAGCIQNFKLFLNGTLALSNCSNFSYIKDRLFVTRSNSVIHIFGINDDLTVTKIDEFKVNSSVKFKKITIGDVLYIIDLNSQVTCH